MYRFFVVFGWLVTCLALWQGCFLYWFSFNCLTYYILQIELPQDLFIYCVSKWVFHIESTYKEVQWKALVWNSIKWFYSENQISVENLIPLLYWRTFLYLLYKKVLKMYYLLCILCNLTLYQGYFMHIRYLPPPFWSITTYSLQK